MTKIEELLKRADSGDQSVMPELKKALDADPSIWQLSGDLALHAEQAWRNLFAGKNVAMAEVVRRKMEEMRKELAGPHPTKLESLLVSRIVACWMQCHYADANYAENLANNVSPAAQKELRHRQESSQRRYLTAIKELALHRKLVRPPLSPVELATWPVNEGKPTPATGAKAREEKPTPATGAKRWECEPPSVPFRRTTAPGPARN